jgi:uncharacterized membrane protein
MSSDQKTNSAIGWTVVGVCVLAAQFAGWVAVLVVLALAVVLLVAVAHINAKMFDAAHQKASERSRLANEAAKAELARTLKEISRLRAHGERRRSPQSVWGRN